MATVLAAATNAGSRSQGLKEIAEGLMRASRGGRISKALVQLFVTWEPTISELRERNVEWVMLERFYHRVDENPPDGLSDLDLGLLGTIFTAMAAAEEQPLVDQREKRSRRSDKRRGGRLKPQSKRSAKSAQAPKIRYGPTAPQM